MITIEQILKDKGNAVITVSDGATLHDAARMLDTKKIGAVVAVDADEMVIGVLSERDIARQVARQGAAALTMKVADAMTRDVIVAHTTESLDAGLARMTDRRIRHLPVLRETELCGLVSIGDLVKWKIAESEAEAEAMKSYITAG